MINDKDHILGVTLEESFEMGRIEGQKAAFKEILELDVNDISYLKMYLKARISSLKDNVIFMSNFLKKRSIR